jgi:multimeric flavodoxin WrbA
MKVLGILGSPRGTRSQTRVLAQAVLEGAMSQGAAVEVVDLASERVDFCTACDACHAGPACVRQDGGCRILEQMLAADGIVLATPVYLNQVTAQMKALLDRTGQFIHCLRLMDKHLAGVTTSGGGGGAETLAFLRKYATLVGAQFSGSVDAAVPLRCPDLAAGRALGVKLATDIRDRVIDPAQAFAIEAHKQHFGRIIEHNQERWGFEHRYWREKGWL